MTDICLRSDRLILRRFEIGDAAALFAYRGRPEVFRYQTWRPKKLEEVVEFIRGLEAVEPNTPGEWLQLAVCIKENGELIGDVGMHFLAEDAHAAEIGYTVSPDYQGREYATEAVKAMQDYLFHTLGKQTIHASVDPRNAPSVAVLEKTGFRLEARFEKSFFMDGEWCDDCIYALHFPCFIPRGFIL